MDKNIQKEMERLYNENSKIPFMLSKNIFFYGFEKGYELSKSQIDNLNGRVKQTEKINKENKEKLEFSETKNKINKKEIEYNIYSPLVYKLREIIESGNADKLYSLYDDISKKLQLLKLEINK